MGNRRPGSRGIDWVLAHPEQYALIKIVHDKNGGTNMSEKEKTELDEIIARCHITKDDLYMEAECVEEYGEWMHMSLMGYSADSLREAAERMTK